MKVLVLSDNRTTEKEFETEHGLSFYLETDNYKCLLDVGASDLFARNAKLMNIDLSEVDYLFISHGHADNIGGLTTFLEINQKAKIVVSSRILNREYFSSRNSFRKISIDFDFDTLKERLITVDEKAQFEEDIAVFIPQIKNHPVPKANRLLFKNIGDELVNDDFDHEVIITFGKERKFVFTGCGHSGLLNILESVTAGQAGQTEAVMGGFHLLDSRNGMTFETEKEIKELGETLKNRFPKTLFVTGHCTGDISFSQLKSTLSEQLAQFYVGYELEI